MTSAVRFRRPGGSTRSLLHALGLALVAIASTFGSWLPADGVHTLSDLPGVAAVRTAEVAPWADRSIQSPAGQLGLAVDDIPAAFVGIGTEFAVAEFAVTEFAVTEFAVAGSAVAEAAVAESAPVAAASSSIARSLAGGVTCAAEGLGWFDAGWFDAAADAASERGRALVAGAAPIPGGRRVCSDGTRAPPSLA